MLRTVTGMHVLVVDDEEPIAELIAAALEAEGMTTACAGDGRSALLAVHDADVVVLDWMLPDVDGLSVLQALRDGGSEVPVVMVTARDALEEKVQALALADDYVTKPFEVEELVARIQAVLRRKGDLPSGGTTILTAGDLAVDTALREVTVRGDVVALTPTEYRLLELLVRRAGKVVSRIDAFGEVWGYDFGGNRANLDTAVSSLRRKLAEHDCDVIETVRGFGYLVRQT
jgi:two-component system OmpR family response regulator